VFKSACDALLLRSSRRSNHEVLPWPG